MHTIAEFRAAADRYTLRSTVGLMSVILGTPATALGLFFFLNWLLVPPDSPPGQTITGWIGGACFVTCVVVLIGGVMVLDRRFKRPAILKCRHCQGSLIEPGSWIVIASRHCPHCGRRVLAEPDDAADQSIPLHSPADLTAAHERAKARLDRIKWPTLLAFVGPLVVGVFLALFRDTIYEHLEPIFGGETVKSVVPAMMILPLLAGAAWMVTVVRRMDQVAANCPHCRAILRPSWAATTGNCGRCGMRVATVQLDSTDGPLIPVEVAVASGRRLTRTAWKRMGIGTATCAAVMIGGGILLAGGRRERFEANLEQVFGAVEAAVIEAVVFGLVELIAVGALFGGVWSAARCLTTPDGGNCPHCGKPNGGAGLTIATKRCCHCLRRIIADPDEPLSGSHVEQLPQDRS
jgi:hypothetical protein